jgi:cytochrome c553
MLVLAFFGIGALAAHAAATSCVECHTNEATMQKLVVPPSGGSAEGEG